MRVLLLAQRGNKRKRPEFAKRKKKYQWKTTYDKIKYRKQSQNQTKRRLLAHRHRHFLSQPYCGCLYIMQHTAASPETKKY